MKSMSAVFVGRDEYSDVNCELRVESAACFDSSVTSFAGGGVKAAVAVDDEGRDDGGEQTSLHV